MSDNSAFVLITPVTHKDINYIESDKTSIAVDFGETLQKLKNIFSFAQVHHHDYIGVREDYVTFLMK